MESASILFVSTDTDIVATVRRQITAMGHDICVAGTLAEAARMLARRGADVLLVQTDAKQGRVWERLDAGLTFRRKPPVIALAKQSSIRDAVRVVRAGAADYVSAGPVDSHALQSALTRAVACAEKSRADRVAVSASTWPFERFITTDRRMLGVCELVAGVADSKAPLLIEGKGGTGKTLLARLMHENSARWFGPFVEVSCGALSDTLLERELFGHVRGAFTSAYCERAGKFEVADGGVILLDEISNASPSLQARLLRVVESGEFERVGDTETLRSDVRIVAATKVSLEERMAHGMFRRDLYHRLGSVRVKLLPLQDRVEDIPLLAKHFLRSFAASFGRDVHTFSTEAMDRLVHYPWPGNVRELRNAVAHGVMLGRSGVVELQSLPERVTREESPIRRRRTRVGVTSLREAMREPERRCILEALKLSGWNKQYAARELRISRSTLYKKIREHRLEQAGPESDSMLSGVIGLS